MKENSKNNFTNTTLKIELWGQNNILRLILFNTILVLLVLLRSAGYFYPFFGISVNFIILVLIILSIVLLHANSRSIFIMSLSFWIFAFVLKFLNLDVWAERTSVYTFEALIVGAALLVFESIKSKKID